MAPADGTPLRLTTRPRSPTSASNTCGFEARNTAAPAKDQASFVSTFWVAPYSNLRQRQLQRSAQIHSTQRHDFARDGIPGVSPQHRPARFIAQPPAQGRLEPQ